MPFFVPALILLAILATPDLGHLGLPFDLAVTMVVLPALVYASATIRVSGRLARFCSWLGAISYGVYVLHVPVYAFGSPIVARLAVWFFGGNSIIAGVLATLAVVLVAWIAERLVDAPIRARLARARAAGSE